MTEENETPKEAKPTPTTQGIPEDVRRMVAAFNLSKTATGYTEGNSETPGSILAGSVSQPNPTLFNYIKIAEKAFIRDNQEAIIHIAEDMIGIELEKIRGLLK